MRHIKLTWTIELCDCRICNRLAVFNVGYGYKQLSLWYMLVKLLSQSSSCSHSVLDCSLVCLVVNYAQFNCQFVRFVVPPKPLGARFPQLNTFYASSWFVVSTGYKSRQMFSPMYSMYDILRVCLYLLITPWY